MQYFLEHSSLIRRYSANYDLEQAAAHAIWTRRWGLTESSNSDSSQQHSSSAGAVWLRS